jgi:predicted TIM-barrel fold metal-dependent hydrolase
MKRGAAGGDVFVIDGLPGTVPMGIIAAAGQNPREMRLDEARFEDLHPGGWNPKARLADQDRDGVVAEVIYPSVGMVLCNHTDGAYMSACFKAYNRWLAEFVATAPNRLIGIGQTAVVSVAEAVADLHAIKASGLRGVMLPGYPLTEFDYDDPAFDSLWQTAVDLSLPLSFHILTADRGKYTTGMGKAERGPKENRSHSIIRANQDIIGMFIWSRIFERFPDLRLVSVESDAGWAPHFIHKLNYHYDRRRFWSNLADMQKRPGDYFRENVYLTFQDDPVAMRTVDMMNVRRMMWANDFPHSDSTWPNSQKLFVEATEALTDQERSAIYRDNTAALYGIA